MAKKAAIKVNRSKEIRDYLKSNPTAKNPQVAAALTKKLGVKISAQYVSIVKSSSKKTVGGKKRSKTARPTKIKSTTKLSLDSIRKAKELADEVGGIEEAKKALEALAELTK